MTDSFYHVPVQMAPVILVTRHNLPLMSIKNQLDGLYVLRMQEKASRIIHRFEL